ncbi:MAG TPA: hypothetical protein DEA08_37460 [Planctomycetes bacterium]|nr:hypothetical protein [Planctomycetota bacterium]
MTMTKTEAKRLSRIAHNALDVLHFMWRAELHELDVEAFQMQFALNKDDAALKKAWNRLKRELEELDVIELERDGKYKPLVLKRGARQRVQELIDRTEEVLEPKPWKFHDQVTIAGVTYRLKVYGRTIRPMNERERADLRESIEADGIKLPIIIDPDGNVVDGKERLLLAHELGIEEIPVEVLRGYTSEQLNDLAEQLSLCRRHLTKQQQAEHRRRRQARAKAKRADGKSMRQIAEEEGVDPKTIEADLGELAVVVTPKKVQRKDGRRRPAKKASAKGREERRENVARLVAAGKTKEEIAEELEVSEGTVKRDLRALKEARSAAPLRIEEEVAPGCSLVVEEITGERAAYLAPWKPEEEVAPGCFLRVEGEDSPSKRASETPSTAAPEEHPAWLDVDAEADALDACLKAAMEGLDEVLDDVRGSHTEDKLEAVRDIIKMVCWRIEDRGVF